MTLANGEAIRSGALSTGIGPPGWGQDRAPLRAHRQILADENAGTRAKWDSADLPRVRPWARHATDLPQRTGRNRRLRVRPLAAAHACTEARPARGCAQARAQSRGGGA